MHQGKGLILRWDGCHRQVSTFEQMLQASTTGARGQATRAPSGRRIPHRSCQLLLGIGVVRAQTHGKACNRNNGTQQQASS